MKRICKVAITVVIVAMMVATLCGCRESYRASYNVKKEADNFNVERHLTVVNARTDTILLDMVGTFAISNNADNELEITVEDANGNYHINYIYLNDDTLYVVEDISGADVSPYHYELNILPEMWQNFSITMNK